MKATAKSLINYFGLTVINKENSDLDREIASVTINRAGLQLGGLEVNDYYRSTVVAWGTKEWMFFSKNKTEDLPKIIGRALTKRTPLLIISKKYSGEIKDLIVQAASTKRIPVVQTEGRIADISVPLASWIAQKQDVPERTHGCLVVINSVGVMITGPSGIGKSEAVLELIHNNHVFVSDDTIDLFKVGQTLYGRSPEITKDLLEARGIGLLNVPQIYGRKAVADRARIELEVKLVPSRDMNKVDRLGNENLTSNHMGIEVDLMEIPTGTGRSLAILIEAAVNVFLSRKKGINPLALIQARTEETE